MKSAINRLPVFYRYLMSYLALFLLPLVFLGVTGYHQLATIVGDEVGRNHQALLDKLQDEVDQKLILMNRIAIQITDAAELSPYLLKDDFYNVYQGKKVLESKVVDDSIREIALHIRGTDYLFSSVSIYKVDQFAQDFYQYANWQPGQFAADLEQLKAPWLRPAESVKITGIPDQRIITYVVPIPVNSQQPYGTVLFMLREEDLLKRLMLDTALPSGNAVVFDQQGRIVAAHKQADYLNEAGFYETVTGGDSVRRELRIDGEPYSVHVQKSLGSGFVYATLLPESALVAPINHAIWQWLSRMAVLFLAGCALVYLLTVFNYNPVKRLAALVDTVRGGHSGRKANEFDAIGSALHDMADSNRSLGRKLQQNRAAIKQHLLRSLLMGQFDSREAFNEQGEEVGLLLPYADTAVLILEFPGSLVPQRDQLVAETEQRFEQGVTGYCMDSLDGRRILMIMSTELTTDEWRDWLNRLHEQLTAEFQAPIAMGAGNRYAEPAQAGRSYLEASTAIDYKLIKGNQRTIYFDELAAHDQANMLSPRRVLEDVDIVLQHGNAARIREAVNEIVQRMKGSGMTLFIARELIYDIIRKFAVFADSRSPESGASGSFPDVLTLTDYTTLDELAGLLESACETLGEMLEARKPASSAAQIEPILLFISQHYSEYDFSVQKVADRFSFSLSYLSRYFKEQTGRTIMDYLNELRIEEAKRLLRTNDDSVKDIVHQVGYYDVSSFIRKFKTNVGVTPGEYRKQHR